MDDIVGCGVLCVCLYSITKGGHMDSTKVTQRPFTEVFNITHKSTQWKRSSERYVYIGRPTFWGNYFTQHKWIDNPDLIIVGSVEAAVQAHKDWLYGNAYTSFKQRERINVLEELPSLVGKRLGCYCYPKPCHGNTFVQMLANGYNIEVKGKRFIWEGPNHGT